jgi:mono/diheme cytochrome c family protein
MVSLAAFLRTLPADPTPSQPHDLRFPYSIRAGVGLWKALYMTEDWAVDIGSDQVLNDGRYIAEALAHCGECHTPRDALGGLDVSRWFQGAANPSGDGRIPAIHPGGLDWSADEITAYLTDGFTPDFDVAGGSMRAVVEGMARLNESDRAAVSAYVKAIPVNN